MVGFFYMRTLIQLFLLLSLSPARANIFNNIDSASKDLSIQIIGNINDVLSGEKPPALVPSHRNSKPIFLNNSVASLCYEFHFLPTINEEIMTYSFSKLPINNINKDGKLRYALKKASNKIQQSIKVSGFYPLNFYLGLSSGVPVNCINMDIPLINTDTNLLKTGNSGLLVEVNSIIEDVNLDTKYSKVLYLDKNLNVIKKNQLTLRKYNLYINLKPGNTILKLGLKDRSSVSDLVHLISDEILFVPERFIDGKQSEFLFFSKNILAQKNAPLILNNRIKSVFTKIKQQSNHSNKVKITFGKGFPFSKNLLFAGEVFYNKNIYYNLNDLKQNIIAPSEDYISILFERNNLRPEDKFCMVELPLLSKISSIDASNSDGENLESVDLIGIDEYGKMSTRFNERTQRVFLIGYISGVIDYKINYLDGSGQYGQVPCAEDSYIIEQLF